MTIHSVTPTASSNNRTRADAAREAYTAPSLAGKPTKAPKAPSGRAWLLAGVAGLLVGAAGAFGLAYQTMPIRATAVDRLILDVDGDGAPDFLVSGWVVFGPKVEAGQ